MSPILINEGLALHLLSCDKHFVSCPDCGLSRAKDMLAHDLSEFCLYKGIYALSTAKDMLAHHLSELCLYKGIYAFSSHINYKHNSPLKKLLPSLSYVYWAKIEQITNWSKCLWANSVSHIYLKLLFNQRLYTKFDPVKVRALKTP